MKIISIIDKKDELSKFQHLYKLKSEHLDAANLSNQQDCQTSNASLDIITLPQSRSTTLHITGRLHQQYYSYSNTSQAEIKLSRAILPFALRGGSGNMSQNSYRLKNDIISFINFFDFFEYDFSKHKELLNDYLPLIIPNEHFLANNFDPNNRTNSWVIRENQHITQDHISQAQTLYNEVVCVFWKKKKNSYTTPLFFNGNKKIYSFFNKDFFEKLAPGILNLNSSTDLFHIKTPINHKKSNPNRGVNRAFNWSNRLDQNLPDIGNFDSHLNICEHGDIGFMPLATISIPNDEDSNETKLLLPYLLNEIKSSPRVSLVKVPSWKTLSKDTTVDLASYTKKQFLTRKTSFAGIIYTWKILLEENTSTHIYYFALASNTSHEDLESVTRAGRKFQSLLRKIYWKDGIEFTDPEKALELKEEMYKGLNLYTDQILSTFSTDQINVFTSLAAPKEESTLSSQQNQLLTLKPKVDFSLEKKFNKIQSKIDSSKKNLSISYSTINSVKRSQQELNYQSERFLRLKKELSAEIQDLILKVTNLHTSALYLKKNNEIFTTIKNQYLQAYEDAIANKSYDLNSFFNNLAKEKISIISIRISDSNTNNLIKELTTATDLNDFSLLFKLSESSEMYISQVEFIIDKPVKISVDSGRKFVSAGPYIVKVTKTDINIKLAHKYSLFGFQGNQFAVHPHVNPISNTSPQNLFNWTRGCLGEASALLFNAFKANDLKLIILSAMTWVTSANSSDVWGKKHSWFLSYESLNFELKEETPPETNVTDSDVQNYLSDFFDEPEEPESLPEQIQNPAPVQDPEPALPSVETQAYNPQTDFTQPQEAYIPFTTP